MVSFLSGNSCPIRDSKAVALIAVSSYSAAGSESAVIAPPAPKLTMSRGHDQSPDRHGEVGGPVQPEVSDGA